MRFYSAFIALPGQGLAGTRALSPKYLPFLPCLSQMYSMGQGQISVLLGWPHSSSSCLNQKGLAGKHFHQGIIFFWNSLPTWVWDISASPVPCSGRTLERMSITVMGCGSSGMSTGATCCALDLQFYHSGCPVWILCCPLAGIFFVAGHSSSQIKVGFLLPHPTLKWNVLCKSFAFPLAETFYPSRQGREPLQPHCSAEPVGFQTQ